MRQLYFPCKCTSLVILFLFAGLVTFGQKTDGFSEQQQVLKIDVDKEVVPEFFPFDQKFKLQIVSKTYKLGPEVHLIESKLKNGDSEPKKTNVVNWEPLSLNLIEREDINQIKDAEAAKKERYRKKGKKNKVKIFRDSITLLLVSRKKISLDYLGNKKREEEIPRLKLPYHDLWNKLEDTTTYSSCTDLENSYIEEWKRKDSIPEGKEGEELEEELRKKREELQKKRKSYYKCKNDLRRPWVTAYVDRIIEDYKNRIKSPAYSANKKEVKKKDKIIQKISAMRDSLIAEHGNAAFDFSSATLKYPDKVDEIKPIRVKLELSNLDKNTYNALIPELPPNRIYQVVFTKLPSQKEEEKIYDLLSTMRKNDAKARLLYMKEIESLEKKFGAIPIKHIYDDYSGFKENSSQQFHDNINLLRGRLFEIVWKTPRGNFRPWNNADVIVVGDELIRKKLNQRLFSVVSEDFLNDYPKQIDILTGLEVIGSSKKIKDYQYGKRRANIEKNIKVLDSLAKELLILKNSGSNTSVSYIFEKVTNILAFSKEVKGEFDKFNKHVYSLMNSKFSFAVPISSGTSNPNVKTRNSQVIVTDFGFLVAGAYNSQGELKIIPRPTAGINLHFGGINKNQKIRSIPRNKRRVWHRTSLALGITVGKIDEKGYSDLFNGISPYLGVNVRLEKQIRIGAGVLFVNDSDPNPITDNKIFDPAIYTMVSFDFENLFGTLGKVATKIIN